MSRMYHTLLPIGERRLLRREYFFRAMVVFCFMLSLAGVIGLVSLFPTYIKALFEVSHSRRDLAAVPKPEKSSDASPLEKSLEADKALIAPLKESLAQKKASAFVSMIVSARGPLRIDYIGINRTGPDTVKIALRGVAPNRDSLLSFKKRFESLTPGNKLIIPVSQLAKSSNLPFSLSFDSKIQ